jgi:hypothetical protein
MEEAKRVEDDVENAIKACFTEFRKEEEGDKKPDEVELFCALLAILLIAVFTVWGAPVWGACFSLLPNVGRTGLNTIIGLISKE